LSDYAGKTITKAERMKAKTSVGHKIYRDVTLQIFWEMKGKRLSQKDTPIMPTG